MAHPISKQLANMATVLKCNFTLKGQPIDYDKVFDDVGLLPALARRADQLCSFCMGYGLGVSFNDAQGTTIGVKVTFDDATPNSLRLLCIADVLIEIMQSAPSRDITPLDDLLYD